MKSFRLGRKRLVYGDVADAEGNSEFVFYFKAKVLKNIEYETEVVCIYY